MFSLEKFYSILYANLLQYANYIDYSYYPFGSTDPKSLARSPHATLYPKYFGKTRHICFCYDQEPVSAQTFVYTYDHNKFLQGTNNILAVSEHSDTVDDICKTYSFKKWYYFFHGFAALDWYRDFQYIPQLERPFVKVFISYNRLVTKDRSYRLNLIAQITERQLLPYGKVSLHLDDNGLGTVEEELVDPNSKLSDAAKDSIKRNITKSITLDMPNPPGAASADSGIEYLAMHQSAFWHLVTETIFYDQKLHLTEKIFKPIIARRPFILVGAVNNLAYLKSYGFKTFDKYIDESYDSIQDPDARINKIVAELEKLCKLPSAELIAMYQDMQDILEFNFNHLYTDFKDIIVTEMLDNFKECAPDADINYAQVKQLLLNK
jgi:hypothetical protein